MLQSLTARMVIMSIKFWISESLPAPPDWPPNTWVGTVLLKTYHGLLLIQSVFPITAGTLE